VLPVTSGRIRRVWVWYLRGSSSRADLRAGGEDRPTLPLEGFHRKRGVRVRRVRLDVQLDLDVQLEALVYNLSSVLVTTTAFSPPPEFVRMDASLLSTPSSGSTDSTPCRFHRKSGVPVSNFARCSLSLSRVSGSKERFRRDSTTTIHRKRGVSVRTTLFQHRVRTTLFQHHRWAPETLLSTCSFYLVSNRIHRLRLTRAIR
jgi:hypothetical protein